MKYIIGCLILILAYSSFMALTTSYRAALDFEFLPNLEDAKDSSVPELNEPVATTEKAEPLKPSETAKALEAPPPTNNNEELKDPPPEEEPEIYQGEPDAYVEDYVPDGSVEQEIANIFGYEYRTALAVAKAESELNPNAMNINRDGSRDIGIFQINERHGWSAEELFDWRRNIAIAKFLRDRNGWGEWTAYNNGAYRKYL